MSATLEAMRTVTEQDLRDHIRSCRLCSQEFFEGCELGFSLLLRVSHVQAFCLPSPEAN